MVLKIPTQRSLKPVLKRSFGPQKVGPQNSLPSFPLYVLTLSTFRDYLNSDCFLRLSGVRISGDLCQRPCLTPAFATFESLSFSLGLLRRWGGWQAPNIFQECRLCRQTARGYSLVPPFHRYVASHNLLKVSKPHFPQLKKKKEENGFLLQTVLTSIQLDHT